MGSDGLKIKNMAKSRAQLDMEAEELGLEPTEYETKADLQAAIDSANQDAGEDLVLVDEDGDMPETQSVGMNELHLETTRNVEFTVNGVHYEGTSFDFESAEEALERKEMLIASYGLEVIK